MKTLRWNRPRFGFPQLKSLHDPPGELAIKQNLQSESQSLSKRDLFRLMISFHRLTIPRISTPGKTETFIWKLDTLDKG